MVSDAAQSVAAHDHWMYPAVTPKAGLPDGFDQLIETGKALLIPNGDVPPARGSIWPNGSPRCSQ